MPAAKNALVVPVHWSVIEKPHPYGRPERKLRIEVTFPGWKRASAGPAFKTERELHEYIDRKWPQLAGKEVPVQKNDDATIH